MDMKKKYLISALFCAMSMTAVAQNADSERIAKLESAVETLRQQVSGLSQRLAGVEQLNLDLRKALDFGKPITTAQGRNGVTYQLISLVGNKAEQTITATVQVATTAEKVDVSFVNDIPSFVDLHGNRMEADTYLVGGKSVVTVYKGAPTNGSVLFKDVNPETTRELKLLKICAQNNYEGEEVLFRDLKVDWK